MNQSLEILLSHGLLLDAFGILGLGLVGMAAARLARTGRNRGGTWMAVGAISLLTVRLYFLAAPHFLTWDFQAAIGPAGIAATIALPPIFLTFGLGAIVGGFWLHERDLSEA